MPNSSLTQKELKRLFLYDKLTGLFTRKVYMRGGKEAGTLAGVTLRNGRYSIRIYGALYQSHRLAWLYVYGVWPKEIDHINHNPSDNRIANLRDVTHIENTRNQSFRCTNTSGVCGVSWRDDKRKWRSYINVNSKQKGLGHYADKFEAICARKSADAKYDYHPNHGR